MKDGFIFYASFYEALQELPPDDQLAAYNAICKYALCGEEPAGSGTVKAIFMLVRPQIDANNKRREAGRKGGEASDKQTASKQEANSKQTASKDEANSKQSESTPEAKVKDKGKVKVKDKEKEIEKESVLRRFAPPTLEEVAAYCMERNNKVDAETFIDFYSAKGWKVGNQPMKDWKACVRTWEKRDRASPRKKNRFENIEQREYNFDALEAELLEMSS